MLKQPLAAAVLLGALGFVSPANAQALAVCTEPVAPPAVKGAGLAQQDMTAAIARVRAFIAESDAFQECLIRNFETQKAQAAAAQMPLDPAAEATLKIKLANNQAAKEKAGGEINVAIAEFRKSQEK